MDYFDLVKGSTGSKSDNTELTFGDLLRECRESAKEKIVEGVPEKHQLKIAKDTLKLSDAGAGIMGGMNKKEARAFLKKQGWSDERIASLEESKEVSEQDYKEDNEELNKDETPDTEDRGKDRSKDPDSDVPPPPDEVKDNDSPMEMRKEYLGKSDETHYYFITTEGGAGDIDDLVIADQDGTKKYSAKEQKIEISEESIADFLIAAIRDMYISSIERSIFLKYIYPKLIEEEPELPEEEEEEELPEEPIEKEEAPEEAKPPRESIVHESEVDEQNVDLSKLGDDELVARYEASSVRGSKEAIAIADEIKRRLLDIDESRLFEMEVTDDKENTFDVYLMDDEEEATTISINGLEHTFSEYSEFFRDREGKLSAEGLRELALDVLANLNDEEYNELAARAGEEDSAERVVAEPDVAHVHNPNESKTESKEIESKENNKGNDMLNEKTAAGLIKDAERAEAKAKAFRKQAADVKAAEARKKADAKAEAVAKEKAAKKKAKESVEAEESKTEINETDVAKGAKALIKLAKDALKDGRYSEAAEHSTKLAEIEAVIPAEAEEEAEKAPDEPAEVDEPAPEEELEDGLEEDVVPKEDAVEEEVVEEDAPAEEVVEEEIVKDDEVKEEVVEEEITDEKKAKPVCKKCGKKHWPFEKCTKAKKESKIEVESTEDINETKQMQSLRNLLDM